MSTRKVNLLSKKEIADYYGLPEFNDYERSLYFELNSSEFKLMRKFTTTSTKIHFLLLLGYFKAKQTFFKIQFGELKDDVRYVFNKYCDGSVSPSTGTISFEKAEEQKQFILDHFQYSKYQNHTDELREHFITLIQQHPKPRSATRELINYCDTRNIILPNYRTLQELYTESHKTVLDTISKFCLSLPTNISNLLDQSINTENDISLNAIRYEQGDFSYTEVNHQIEKVRSLSELYVFCKTNTHKFKLSRNALSHYAQLIEQYPIAKIRKMTKVQQYLHVISFIHQRYQELVDSLIESFLHHMTAVRETVKLKATTDFANHAATVINKYPNLIQFFRWFPQQESQMLSKDNIYQQAYEILPKEDFTKFADFFEGKDFDREAYRWKYFQEASRLLSLYLRPIVMTIDFEHYKPLNNTMLLLKILKNHYQSGKSPSQLKLADDLGLSISKRMTKYLKTNEQDQYLNPYRFEYFVYQKIFHQLNRGQVFCNDSISYKDIDKDLVPGSMVQKVAEIAEKYGYKKLAIYCDARLDQALDELNKTWSRVSLKFNNQSIEGVKFTTDNNGELCWSLEYEAGEEIDDGFFDEAEKIDISKVFLYINTLTKSLDEFEHIKGRYVKHNKPDAQSIIACVLAEAFGFGIQKMADISDLNFNNLRSTHENFMRVETLAKASGQIADFVNELPIFKAWDLLDNKTLADIDGQKAATKKNTIHSRYSKKYLGKGKGLSILSLIANYISVNVKNIGLNQYEGNHLFDMVYGNNSNIKIGAVTGDNHSTNKLNYVALDTIDVDFVPSIKNIRKEADKLYSTRSTSEYSGILVPEKQIDVKLIRSQKLGIIRVLLSLILQQNTQHIIIKKLNSHARYARLRKALYEYNNIFRSTHILNLIEDLELRQAIKSARNRTESHHQLQKVIRNMYQGVYRSAKASSNAICTHSVRLITNTIVAYNAIILNRMYESLKQKNVPDKELEKFLRISPMSWVHIALTGKYTFGNDDDPDISGTISALEKSLKKNGIIGISNAA